LEKNYRSRYGEIDIIARKGRNLIFAEVKTRTNLEYGDPLEAVNRLKMARIKKVASLYIASNKLSVYSPGFNVISIIISRSLIEEIAIKESTLQAITSLSPLKGSKDLKIEHIENAF